ncbi:MAG: single-stranded-DNA-specific exonuclease RecJ [Cyanobacteria bacterium P01_E01_bin.6]
MIRTPKIPNQRWHIAAPNHQKAAELSTATDLPPLLTQVLLNRGIDTAEAATQFLHPEQEELPSPLDAFPDLGHAIEILSEAIAHQHKIAVCGDYDADGMTSTALLIRAMRRLGAAIDYAIPSRMSEGYGINERIVEDFHAAGVSVLLTVDNGIAAYNPIARARELGLSVIVTDHHDVPLEIPPANAILNPKLIDPTSPYRGLAGVGVAYLLALSLAEALDSQENLAPTLLELFTLGTIADLAPLTGVNRRWVQQGLTLLPQSQIEGVKALLQVSGLSDEKEALKPEAIGFRLGPRINAVGRIGDPAIVIELLTTEEPGHALEMAMKCEAINKQRRDLCETIEQEAIAHIEAQQPDLIAERVLVVVQSNWHHGVIGIVASRLVERYGVPVFIGTYEDDEQTIIRGSARSIPEFHVSNALQFCGDTLKKFGGHRAAGGFSLQANQLANFQLRLQVFANMYLLPQHLKPLVTVDVQASLPELTMLLYEQINQLHPCGMGNPDPVFWTPNVRIVEQGTVGRDRAHLKLMVTHDAHDSSNPTHAPSSHPSSMTPKDAKDAKDAHVSSDITLKAIAWRLGGYCPLPNRVDLAYRLRLNEWKGKTSVELEVIGIRASTPITDKQTGDQSIESASGNGNANHLGALWTTQPITFQYGDRQYWSSMCCLGDEKELRIRNPEGKVLAVQPSQKRGLIGANRDSAEEVNVFEPHYFNLICAAMTAFRSHQATTS